MCSVHPCFQDWCDALPLNNTAFQAHPFKINGPFPARGFERNRECDWFCWIRNYSFCMSPWCCDLWNTIIYQGERLNSLIWPQYTELGVTSEHSLCFITCICQENAFCCWSKCGISKHKKQPNHILKSFNEIWRLMGHVSKYWLDKKDFYFTAFEPFSRWIILRRAYYEACYCAQCTLDR